MELPILERADELIAAIAAHQVVIVAGETGSGKSTQLPQFCVRAGRGVDGMIGHTQPRRIAARTIADRIAEEMGCELGTTVGYAVRFTDRVGEQTRIKVMTDGILLAEIQRDRMLRRYDTMIIDEAHERSLNIDFLLGYIRQLLPRRPDLKLIVTSATIDTQRFSEHFDNAPIITVEGRTYPVEIRYRPLGDDHERDQVQAVCAAVDELSHEGPGDVPGDVLVFLSGEREIHDTADALRRLNLRDTEVLPLYARLSSVEQHRIFQSHRGRRIVLSTNVAETSLTVPGVRYVVDPGTARISRYSHRLKVQRLPIEPVSRASADQRAGRCGRVAPGICIRLYDEEGFRRSPGVHRTRDPAHQPGLGHPADDRPRPGRRRRLSVHRATRQPLDPRRLHAARRTRRTAAAGKGDSGSGDRSAVDRGRSATGPPTDRPAYGPDGGGSRPARLRARGDGHRRGPEHPRSARAPGRTP